MLFIFPNIYFLQLLDSLDILFGINAEEDVNPTIKIGHLARDRRLTNKGFGEILLLSAIEKCVAISRLTGIYAIEVNALNKKVAQYYKSYGFIPFKEKPLTFYIPLKHINDFLQD